MYFRMQTALVVRASCLLSVPSGVCLYTKNEQIKLLTLITTVCLSWNAAYEDYELPTNYTSRVAYACHDRLEYNLG